MLTTGTDSCPPAGRIRSEATGCGIRPASQTVRRPPPVDERPKDHLAAAVAREESSGSIPLPQNHTVGRMPAEQNVGLSVGDRQGRGYTPFPFE